MVMKNKIVIGRGFLVLILAILALSFFLIQQVNAEVYQTQWGSYGTGNGEFIGPWGVAIDSSGNVYVTDESNHLIQKFDENGNYLTQWGSEGTGNGEFKSPSGIAIDSSGNIYVSDLSNHRIQKFDANGNYITQWGSEGTENGQFYNAYGIAVDTLGNVYVADSSNRRIQKFDANGNYIAQWGSFGTGNGEFDESRGIAIDSSDNVYVTDRSNHRIQKFDASGNYITQWGSYGTGNGEFERPSGIVVDSLGYVYISDENCRIQKFDENGNYITQWGSIGSENGQFWYPEEIAVDSSGNIYVADYYNQRIQKFRPFTDAEAVAAELATLASTDISGTNTDLNNVTVALASLPTSGANGTTISWTSSNGSIVSNDGQTVNRPAFGIGDASITLTATVSKNAESDTKVFNITVLKMPPTDAEAVAADKATLASTDISGANTDLDNVIVALASLPTTGANGTTISWESSNESILSNDGQTIIRPVGLGDASITLTATVSKNAESDTKVFNITVISDKTALSKWVSGGNNFTVGEPITFELKLRINEGTTEKIVIKELLPGGMAFNSASIVKYNENISYVLNNEPVEGDIGELVWDLRTIVNPVNGDDKDDIIIVEYTVIIQDEVENVRGKWLTNRADLEFTDGGGNVHTIPNKTGSVIIIEPELKIEAEITSTYPYDVGDTVTHRITISHTGESNATAYDVKITDILPEGLSYASYTADPSSPGEPIKDGNNVVFGGSGNIDLNLGKSYTFNVNTVLDTELEPQKLKKYNMQVDYSSINGESDYERYYTSNLVGSWDIPDEETVNWVKKVLKIIYTEGDSADSVTQGLTLPTTGGYGTTITWTSSNGSILSNDGQTVNRPAFGSGDASITLTATVSKNAESEPKVFNITVKRKSKPYTKPEPEEEKVTPEDLIKQSDEILEDIEDSSGVEFEKKVNDFLDKANEVLKNQTIDTSTATDMVSKIYEVIKKAIEEENIEVEKAKEVIENIIESNVSKVAEMGQEGETKKLKEIISKVINKAGEIEEIDLNVESTKGESTLILGAKELIEAAENAIKTVNELSKKAEENGMKELTKEFKAEVKIEVPEEIKEKEEVKVELPLEALNQLADKEIDISIEADGVTFKIPSELVGLSTDNFKVEISTKKVDDEKEQELKDSREDKQVKNAVLELKSKPLDLNINKKDEAGNTTTKIEEFNKQPVIEIPLDSIDLENVDINKLGIYVFDEENGKWEYIKTEIKDGKLVAIAPHFSIYAVLEFNKEYMDIKGHWAKEDIDIMAAKHIANYVYGEDNLVPQKKITRAEFATLIVRALGIEKNKGSYQFDDVDKDSWYANDIALAADAGIINGIGNRQFAPNENITREQMAVMMARAYKNINGKDMKGEEITFPDKDDISSWAVEAVKAAFSNNIVIGFGDGTFKPQENTTRAQGIVMLKRLLDI